MELTLKSGQHLQSFLSTTPWEGTKTDAVKFSLIFIPYAGSQEYQGDFSFPMNKSSGGKLCPSSKPTKFSSARKYGPNTKWHCWEVCSMRTWRHSGKKKRKKKKQPVQNNPPVLNKHQMPPERFCLCNRGAQDTQRRYAGLGKSRALYVNNLLFSFLGSKETNSETPVIPTQDNYQRHEQLPSLWYCTDK